MKTLTDILIISLFCNGWYLITRRGMLLYFLHDWYLLIARGYIRSDDELVWSAYPEPNVILKFLYKPLFACLPCMASIWGSLAYFALGNQLSWEYLITIIAVACVNLLINKIYE